MKPKKKPTLVERVAVWVTLEKKGEEQIGLCPFHEASVAEILTVTAERWYCAACTPKGGTEVDWVIAVEQVSSVHAEELVRDGVMGPRRRRLGRPKGDLVRSSIRRLRAPFSVTDSDEAVLEKVADYYHEELMAHTAARRFLSARCIEGRVLQVFRIGYANRRLGLRMPSANRIEGAELRGRLTKLGVLRDTGHEALRGAIVVPIGSMSGPLANLYGRKMDKRYLGEHFWTNETKTGLFNAKGIESAKEIVIAGSVLDALSIWVAGLEHVTALHGADGPMDEIAAAVEGARSRRVVLAFRRTAEMEEATRRLVARLAPREIEVLQMVLPMSEDVNDVLCGPDGGYRVKELYRLAEWIGGVVRGVNAPGSAPKEVRQSPSEEPKSEEGQVYLRGDRRWRIRGLADNPVRGTLKVNVFVSREDVGFHVDTFDLYSARQRAAFVQQAASELRCEEALVKKDLGHVLLALEQEQNEMIEKRNAPKTNAVAMSLGEREDALDVLRDPSLLEKVLGAFEVMGVVGERKNLLAGYLVGISRKLKDPLAMVIQSSTAAGKTAVLDAIVALVPEEDRASYAAISGQSLYYMGARSLRHRLLSIAEHTGAEKASYALKLLQSSKSLTIASTGKDTATGRITSHEYTIEGPVALMVTTTKVELDEELQNRCLVVTIDESPEQTRAVHEEQRRTQTLEGIEREISRHALVRLHQNIQRLIRPLHVVNPHAAEIHFGDRRVRARRDHRKLLSLIEAIALVHQHQRPIRSHKVGEQVIEYIEATREDVERAEELLEALVGTGADDVPPRTRQLLSLLSRYVWRRDGQSEEAGRRLTFTRREVRDALGWGDTQLKTHLKRLIDAELVIVRRAPHGGGVAYELAFDARELEMTGELADGGRGEVGRMSGLGRGHEKCEMAFNHSGSEQSGAEHPGIASSSSAPATMARAS